MATATRMSISRTSGTQSARIASLIIKVKCSSIEDGLKNEIMKELEYIDMLNERQFAETQQVLSGIGEEYECKEDALDLILQEKLK